MYVRVCACFDKLFNKSYLEGGFNFKLITAIYPTYKRKQREGRSCSWMLEIRANETV